MDTGGGRRAIIVGGSVAGIAAALLLRQDGWMVDVYERAESGLEGRGAGIATHPELFAAFAAAGITLGHEIGFWVEARRVFGADGSVLGEMALPQLMASWDRLYAVLHAALPGSCYHLGRRVVGLEQDGRSVTARLADGTTQSADLLIGADGFRSTVREQLFPEARPHYAGYIVWRGLIDEDLVSPATHRDLFGYFSFGFIERGQLIGYAVAGAQDDTRAGHRRFNWGWYRQADEAGLQDVLRDETGHVHDLSIPPPLIRAEVIAELRAAGDRDLPPQFRELLRLNRQPFFQPIYDFETPRMVIGRVALMGDAAYLARPHVGAGVNKATGDALSLAMALRATEGDLDAALARFAVEREPEGAMMVAHGRALGAYMQARTDAERRAAMRFRDPSAIMTATANMEYLRQTPPN